MTLNQFQKDHGIRVRRAEAMALLGHKDKAVFKKVVDANPAMKHRLGGEGQDKYLTSVIYDLLYPARCASRLEEAKTGSHKGAL